MGEASGEGAPRAVVMPREGLQQLLEALSRQGYQLIGPTVRDGAIVYDTVRSLEEFPVGWTDEQAGGAYRLKRRGDRALFGYAVGPQSWKAFLFPPALRVWQAARDGGGWSFAEERGDHPRYAFIGVRACELSALIIQDHVLAAGACADPVYQARRTPLFLIAVNCVQAGGTCFCASMRTGPAATRGFDLALTERLEGTRHEFLVDIGSARGEEALRQIPRRPAREADRQWAEQRLARTASQMGRTLETAGIKELLYRSVEHRRWEAVAERCLSCGNCTMVCPTCFCSTLDDVTDLRGARAERIRRWDSCFTAAFSYLHGGSVRSSVKARYRQWLTHKFAAWIDQFGVSGCVGCGRCVTWCPVGIDVTEELRAIRADQPEGPAATGRPEEDIHVHA